MFSIIVLLTKFCLLSHVMILYLKYTKLILLYLGYYHQNFQILRRNYKLLDCATQKNKTKQKNV